MRDVAQDDLAAVTAIYGHYVLTGLGTFEETPPTPEEMASRIAAVTAGGLPYLVAEEGAVLGFASAARFRPRTGYRYTAEDSVYVAPGAARRGVGRALLAELIARCEAMGLRQMIAVIGDAANAASIGLHASLGFAPAGACRSVGFKHGRWVDIVWMQRTLGEGDTAPPSP